MSNTVTVAYPTDNGTSLNINYAIEQTDDVQTISCSVEGSTFPIWLQLRKFTLSSLQERDGYIALYNEINDSKNMDTTLFIDLVYSRIMTTEHFRCKQ